jgi:hypothetical protein
MNISLRKLFCALICGTLVLTAVPAKAEFNISDWLTPKVAMVAAGVVAACWLVKKCFFEPIRIKNIVELSYLKNFQHGESFYISQDISLTGDNPFEANVDVLPVGKYTIFEKNRYENSVLNVNDIKVVFESSDQKSRYALIFKHGGLDSIRLATSYRTL